MKVIINPAIPGEPHYFDEDKEHDTRHFPFVYLHGQLEELFGTDQCGIVYENPNSLEPGIHECIVLGIEKDCILFIWRAERLNKGLVVLEEDKTSLMYANECYNSKLLNI